MVAACVLDPRSTYRSFPARTLPGGVSSTSVARLGAEEGPASATRDGCGRRVDVGPEMGNSGSGALVLRVEKEGSVG